MARAGGLVGFDKSLLRTLGFLRVCNRFDKGFAILRGLMNGFRLIEANESTIGEVGDCPLCHKPVRIFRWYPETDEDPPSLEEYTAQGEIEATKNRGAGAAPAG